MILIEPVQKVFAVVQVAVLARRFWRTTSIYPLSDLTSEQRDIWERLTASLLEYEEWMVDED